MTLVDQPEPRRHQRLADRLRRQRTRPPATCRSPPRRACSATTPSRSAPKVLRSTPAPRCRTPASHSQPARAAASRSTPTAPSPMSRRSASRAPTPSPTRCATPASTASPATPTTSPGTGTVSITVGPSVWFIDNTAPAGGNGTQASPFNSIAAFNAAQGTANGPDAGDFIYLRHGTGTYAKPTASTSPTARR